LIKSAVIASNGGGTGIHDTSIIIEKDRLLVCCSDSVFCLSIPDLTLLWRTQADQVTCLEIYKYEDSYIIHGELEISRIDKNGKILWQQIGADIFTTLEGKDTFVITYNYIIATDWENRKYKFDFNGQSIL
jgi:outer membrane protein assembly factor BamB